MESYFDPTIPTEVITARNVRILVCLMSFWTIGAIIPLIFWPRSYVGLAQLEHKMFPESKKYKFDRYLYSNEVYAYIEKFTRFHRHKARILTITPPTYEGRNIKVMHLRLPQYYENIPKKGNILVAGGMYACLWDSVSAAIDLMHKLLEDCRYKVPYLLEYDWYIIPVVNPDGYDYTLSMRDKDVKQAYSPKNRNPNRQPDNTKNCYGVYLDRNFGFHWGESKHVDYHDYCWMGYAGPKPFSENESKAVINFVKQLRGNDIIISMYLQLHGSSSRDDITYPWRFTKVPTFNQPVLNKMAKTAAAEVNALTGISFTYIQGGKRDFGSGVLVDYLMGILHILYNFSIEPTYESFVNSTDMPEPHIYMEKAITIVFALVKQLRVLPSPSTANSLIFHQSYFLFYNHLLFVIIVVYMKI